MGSAKTALLLTTAYNFEERNMDYMCLKPIIDTRENASVIRSRIGIERECHWIYQTTTSTNSYVTFIKKKTSGRLVSY